ncbi:MAG: cell division protein FtsZ, partial [Alphaproteobacteria bacterium]|nr:cell division protein FtsZ [Alphaproteobacteria bacterium]
MSIEFHASEANELSPRISVIGVGGAGGNAVANMIAAQVRGVDFIVANTDAQALNSSAAENRIQLGLKMTQGLGAGAKPEIGRAAAEEATADIEKALEGAHMCFIAAGMGGGTGTGAAPVIAKLARDRGILTVGVVTKPFSFEGSRRMKSAEAGIIDLQKHVDTLIVIPNQNLFLVANADTTFREAFQMADEVLQQGVRSITDLMVMPGLINLDFADVRSVMGEMGKAMMGTGEASGDNRAVQAAERAIANPLLDGVSMKGAKGVIISITGGDDMRLMEVDEAASTIKELVDPDANIIWGSAFNNELDGVIRVSVVATGIEAEAMEAPEPARVFAFPNAKKEAIIKPAKATVADMVSVEAAPGTPAPMTEETPAASAAPVMTSAEVTASPSMHTDEAPVIATASVLPPAADELVLGAEDMLELSEEVQATEPAAEASKTHSWLAPGKDEAIAPLPEAKPAEPAPRIAHGGGTLFERMSNIAKGNARGTEDAETKSDPLDIPRFLN